MERRHQQVWIIAEMRGSYDFSRGGVLDGAAKTWLMAAVQCSELTHPTQCIRSAWQARRLLRSGSGPWTTATELTLPDTNQPLGLV